MPMGGKFLFFLFRGGEKCFQIDCDDGSKFTQLYTYMSEVNGRYTSIKLFFNVKLYS